MVRGLARRLGATWRLLLTLTNRTLRSRAPRSRLEHRWTLERAFKASPAGLTNASSCQAGAQTRDIKLGDYLENQRVPLEPTQHLSRF